MQQRGPMAPGWERRAFLEQQPGIRAVKIEHPISNATANLIFNNAKYHVSYVLGDLESVNATNQAAPLGSGCHRERRGYRTKTFRSYSS